MFVVIEGIDGAGCETQAQELLQRLSLKGVPNFFFKYPNYTRNIGREIQRFLYDDKDLTPHSQFLLYSLQFVIDSPTIEKKRKNGIIIADRYFSTTLCFQTIAGIPMKTALQFADDFAIAKPDLIIFLDVEPEIARTRKTSELKKKNWMEKDFELTQKTYKQYKSLIKSQTWARWVSVDGSGEIDPIADTIFDIIQKELDKK